jgi:hypothetical protein
VNGVLEKLHEKHHIDEFILHTPILKEEERFRSFQLLSPNYSAKSAHRIEVRTEPVRG